MTLDLFAGIAVADHAAALVWYECFFGGPPTYVVSDTEALWEVTEHGSVVVELRPDRAGHAFHTLFVTDFDERVAAIGERGLQPTRQETYDNGVRKVIYHDPEGNEISYGGAPEGA